MSNSNDNVAKAQQYLRKHERGQETKGQTSSGESSESDAWPSPMPMDEEEVDSLGVDSDVDGIEGETTSANELNGNESLEMDEDDQTSSVGEYGGNNTPEDSLTVGMKALSTDSDASSVTEDNQLPAPASAESEDEPSNREAPPLEASGRGDDSTTATQGVTFAEPVSSRTRGRRGRDTSKPATASDGGKGDIQHGEQAAIDATTTAVSEHGASVVADLKVGPSVRRSQRVRTARTHFGDEA